MTESNDNSVAKLWITRAWMVVQWPFFLLLAVFLAFVAFGMSEELAAPGAPVGLFYASVAVFAVFVIAMIPPLFFRVSGKMRGGLYGGLLAAFIFHVTAFSQVTEAYERTPEGAARAEERAEEQAAEDEASRLREAEERQQERDQAALDRAQASIEAVQEIAEQQEDCLSWGGELRDLNSRVRESLHNPNSFEHVETRFVVPTDQGYNVEMSFRAENGFGATRTNRVLAQMVPATCEIIQISAPM